MKAGRAWAPAAALALLLSACPDRSEKPPPESLRSLAPPPLPSLHDRDAGGAPEDDRAALHQVVPAEVFGEEPPSGATRLQVSGRKVRLDGKDFDLPDGLDPLLPSVGKRALLVAEDGDVFLAQLLPLLERLDDGEVETWILHPAGQVAFKVALSDEAAFQKWLDEPRPGKVRVIQRADGFELATSVGKLPGADPNGPTVPIRGGQMDVATLRRGLVRLKAHFSKADDTCLLPSYGIELVAIARALSGFYQGKEEPIFDRVCLVYPRRTRSLTDGGAVGPVRP